jgi:predicted GNAT superfamily acetyltransferase
VSIVETPLVADLSARAAAAARRADVEVRIAADSAEVGRISSLLADVWGTAAAASPGPRNILTALLDTGGYVAGAWRSDRLVGASFGLVHLLDGRAALRSQVTAAIERGGGIGEATKRHQLAWAAERGMDQVTWTFDPLVRANARFNLMRLGARIVRFVPDFYGSLDDGMNGADETDRCVVSWTVADGVGTLRASRSTAELVDGGHSVLLDVDERGLPVIGDRRPPRLLVRTPDDIVELRRTDPAAAVMWRRSLRAAFESALASGLAADMVTADGAYRFAPAAAASSR